MSASMSPARRRALQFAERAQQTPTVGPLSDPDAFAVTFIDRETQQPDRFEVEALASLPNLAAPTMRALIRNSQRSEVRTRQGRRRLYRVLRPGLLQFLVDTDRSEFRPQDIDRSTLSAFIAWLDRTKDGVASLTQYVRSGYFAAAVQLLELMRSDPEIGTEIIPVGEIPDNPWPNAHRHIEGTKEVQEEHLRLIFRALVKDVRQISRAVEADLSLVAGATPNDPVSARRKRVLEAMFDWQRENGLNQKNLERADRSLWREIEEIGSAELYRVVQPSAGDILPFALLIAFIFRLNEEVLLNLKVTDFQTIPMAGGTRLLATPYKTRKGSNILASEAVTKEEINPASMISLLERWTAHLRAESPGPELFLFWIKQGLRRGIGHFASGTKSAPASLLKGRIAEFIERHQELRGTVEPFTVTQIRHALLELAHKVSDGDMLKVRAAGSHAHVRTTEDHYTTPAAKARDREKLANSMIRLQTLIATKGRMDPRGGRDGGTSGATPGWSCARGAKSPFGSEREDGICVAYGQVPRMRAWLDGFRVVPCVRLFDPPGGRDRPIHRSDGSRGMARTAAPDTLAPRGRDPSFVFRRGESGGAEAAAASSPHPGVIQ